MNILDFIDIIQNLDYSEIEKLSDDWIEWLLDELSDMVQYCEREQERRDEKK